VEQLLAWSSVGLGVGTTVFVCVLIARRLVLDRERCRRREAEERLRPLALALLETGLGPTLDSSRDLEILASILARYARHVRGDAREVVVRFFEQDGGAERELAALGDRRRWRRAAAAYALGDMGSKDAVLPLLQALGDRDRDVRAAAARSLGRIGAGVAVEPLVRALVEEAVPAGVAGKALLGIGSAALPALRDLIAHPEAALREAAVELLGLVGGPNDAPLLVGRLRDSSAEVRAAAARALARLAAEDAVDAVRGALSDRIPFVRAAAASALGAIAGRAVARDLLDVARSDSYEPAQAAARALERVDPALLAGAARAGCGPHVREFADRAVATR